MVFTTIFNSLFTFLKTTAVLIYLNEYFKNTYPQKYQETLINVSFKLVYLYSKGQLVFFKVHKNVSNFIDSNPHIKKLVDEICKKNIQN